MKKFKAENNRNNSAVRCIYSKRKIMLKYGKGHRNNPHVMNLSKIFIIGKLSCFYHITM